MTTPTDRRAITGLEGFARSALLASYRIVGSDDPKARDPLLSWLGKGVDVGTRLDGPGSWPRPDDRHQSIVEAAWVAISLAETQADLWDQLGHDTRRRVVQWLASVRGKAVHPNNWLLYPVVVDAFLERVSGPADPDASALALRQVDALHHRDGWYSDGPGSCFGHYSAWGMQLLLAHWLRLSGGDGFPGGPQVLRDRLRCFLAEYAHLVGADGGPVFHGRSPIYRIAVAAPFWLGTLVGASPFSPGATRGITSAVVRHFALRGAFEEGIPSFGWYGPFPAIADPYSSPVSALISSEAFVGLVLPPDHEVWTAVESGGPASMPIARTLAAPGFVCLSSPDGVTRVASHGSSAPSVAGHRGYRKVGYSNRTSPTTGPLGDADIDGQITVLAQDGTPLRRRVFELVAVGDRFASSTWFPEPAAPPKGLMGRVVERLPDRIRLGRTKARSHQHVRVETASVATSEVEMRITHLWSLDPAVIRDGGLAVSDDEPPVVSQGDGWCLATTSTGLTGGVVGLYGWGASGSVDGVDASPFGRYTVVPYLDGGGDGPEALLVTAHVLSCGAVHPDSLRAQWSVDVLSCRAVALRSSGGDEFLVQLHRPGPLLVRLGGELLQGVYRYARWSPDGETSSLPA